jgi:uncharacterized protein (UPF0332 family)
VADDLKARIVARLDKARRKLATARKLIEQEELEDAAGRAYYAMYHAAFAALLPKRASPRTHKGLATMLSMHRVKTGEISVDLYRAFVAARDQREYGDYEVATIIGPELARRTVADAATFIDAVEALLRAEGQLG